jgi:hypothetical protein
MEKYYSDFEKMLELSDMHVLWNCGTLESDKDFKCYNMLCDEKKAEFEEIYQVEVFCLGRSGRHVCVRDTAKNRMSYANMKRTVSRMQREIIARFSPGGILPRVLVL